MKTDGPETDTRKRGAYFVRFRPADGRVGMVPISEDAPDEVLLGLKWIARDWSAKSLVGSPFQRLCRQVNEGKPATAITIEPYESKKLPVVRPLEVAFEPVVLDETSPTLVELAREAAGISDTPDADQQIGDVSAARRFMLRTGVHVFWGVYSTAKIVSNYRTWGATSGWTVFWFSILLFTVILPIAWHFLRPYSWLIVPGGVIVRGSLRRRRMGKSEMFTPLETVLIIEPNESGYRASLIRDDVIAEQLRLTMTESVALLGAWQSSIAPPELERLVDLR